VRYWLHNVFVNVDKEKMSKSIGNVLLVHELLKQAPGEAIRLALLSAHYRQPLDWTDDGLAQAVKMLDRLYGALRTLSDVDADPSAEPDEAFLRALGDDLNTPQALAALFELARQANTAEDPADKARVKSALLKSANLMGLLTQDPEDWFAGDDEDGDGPDADEIERLVQARKDARGAKDFAEADRIRDDLSAHGITLEDGADGTKWRRG
jgi:cysteinyl-tRNA synthetase